MVEPYIGQISIVAFNFPPRGWAKCDGQLMAISQNDALFSLIGTIYGGDGRTTFGLPDMRGRLPMHMGAGPGLSSYREGQKGGAEEVTLTTSTMPSHTHAANASNQSGEYTPIDHFWGVEGTGVAAVYNNTATGTMNVNAISPVGGSQPHNNMQPFLVLNFVIALFGVYPPRS